MAPITVNLTIYQGESFSKTFTARDVNGSAINLTDYIARMQIRLTVDAETPLADLEGDTDELTLTDNLTITAADGTILVELDAATTAGYNFETAVYDLEIENADGIVTKLARGGVVLIKEVTR
jgi:hypothetical protein